ncbi:MAG TPA: 2TM domain-containing protein [Microbacterium sp.]|nr:2TM domain-containing protein [Microbacterium sp.]
MSDSSNLRDQAISSLKAKRGFWNFLLVAVVISALMVVVWALTGMGYFWPMWPMFGLAIAVVFSAIGAFGPGRGRPSEAQIQAEMRKLDG